MPMLVMLLAASKLPRLGRALYVALFAWAAVVNWTTALGTPEVRARLATLLAEPAPTTPEQFAAFVKSELAKYEPIVKASGAKAD